MFVVSVVLCSFTRNVSLPAVKLVSILLKNNFSVVLSNKCGYALHLQPEACEGINVDSFLSSFFLCFSIIVLLAS